MLNFRKELKKCIREKKMRCSIHVFALYFLILIFKNKVKFLYRIQIFCINLTAHLTQWINVCFFANIYPKTERKKKKKTTIVFI